MSNEPLIAAVRQALESDRRNGTLWLHLADLLAQDEQLDGAIDAVRVAAELPDVRDAARLRLVGLLRQAGRFDEALLRAESLLEEARAGADTEAVAGLEAELALIQAARGQTDEAKEHEVLAKAAERGELARASDGLDNEQQSLADWADQFDWGELRTRLDDVVGLEEVKRQIHLRVVAPFKQPEIYQAFGRDGGGGILLYGPPGCGKTYIARATAGELGARFVSVSIHDILSQYYGQSEKQIHALFENARRNSPTVLFFDEFDALGGSRGHGRGDSQFWKTLVDQLLQEMDGVQGKNRDVLIFGATNMPWNVDMAFRRPGRFDRVLFVPPPDAAGRRELIEKRLAKLPGAGGVRADALAKQTEHFTGADLAALCARAAENALAKSLESGQVHDVTQADFDQALRASRPSSIEWFGTARNYGRYSNEGGQYDDLVEYLRQVGKW